MKKYFFTLLIFFAVLLDVSCTLYQKPKVPMVNTPEQFQFVIDESSLPLDSHWWKNFHDPQLDAYVEVAEKNNYDYRIALKNIKIAKTFITQNESAAWPQVDLNYVQSRNRNAVANAALANANQSKTFNLHQLFGSLSYQIDVWNQIGNSVKAARADVQTSKADAEVIKLSLIVNVVNTYFRWQALCSNERNLMAQLNDLREQIRLAMIQEQSGLINHAIINDLNTQADDIAINLVAIHQAQEITRLSLAYLLGEFPERFHPASISEWLAPDFNNLIPAALPAKMLLQRPDIQAAYHQVLSFGYLEKASLANFFPAFNLTGQYGYASHTLSDLIRNGNIYWSYGGSALQNLFDYSLRQSEHHRARLQYESAILSYKKAILNAFTEVNTALITFRTDSLALHATENQLSQAREKLALMNAQYKAGLVDYSTLLAARVSFLQIQLSLTSQELILLQDVVQVYQTLGLGLN